MGKQVILAVAGAGKTYSLCHKLNPKERNLIIAYTNQNVFNIKKELVKACGEIPIHTKVMTFHSFIYQFFICPYEPTIKNFFKFKSFNREGISFKKPPEARVFKNGRCIPNKAYHRKDEFEHYTIKNRYYCSLMSELILSVKNKKLNLQKRCISNLIKFFDHVYVDEFQDFREYDYKFLMTVVKGVKNITLVGDYFQHSVSGQNNNGQPFKNKRNYITYEEYINLLEKANLDIDNKSLIGSRRCPKEICSFIAEKLKIKIDADNENNGCVIFVRAEDMTRIIEDDKIKKLVYMNADKYTFNVINWGYSKGDTYKHACVILTDTFDDIDKENFAITYTTTINKLYVALSRTKGNLYIIKKKDFDLVKGQYLQNS